MSSKIEGISYFTKPLPEEFYKGSQGTLVTFITRPNAMPHLYVLSMGSSILCSYEDQDFIRKYDLDNKDSINAYIAGIVKRQLAEDNKSSCGYFTYDDTLSGSTLPEAYKHALNTKGLNVRRPRNSDQLRQGNNVHYHISGHGTEPDDLMSLLGINGVPDKVNPTSHIPDPTSRGEYEAPLARTGAPHRSMALNLRSPKEYLSALRRK